MKLIIIIISMVLVSSGSVPGDLPLPRSFQRSGQLHRYGYRCYIRYGSGNGCYMADPAAP